MTEPTSGPKQQPPALYQQQLTAFAEELRDLRISCGNPSLRGLQKAAPSARPLSVSAVSEALAGKRLPRLDFVMALVQTLLGFEDGGPVGRDDPRVKPWRMRWQQLERARVNARLLPPPRSEVGADTVGPRLMQLDEPIAQQPNPQAGPGAAYRLERTLNAHTNIVRSVAFSPDGCLLATAGDDTMVRLWYPVTGQPVREPLSGHTSPVLAVRFSPDGHLLAAVSQDGSVRLWDPATGRPVPEPLPGHADVTALAFSPNGCLLATGSYHGPLRLWDPATGRPVGEPLTGHTDYVYAVVFSPDGHLLTSASQDRSVRLWDPATGRPVRDPLTGHTDDVYAVAFSPDGRLLASAGADNTVRLWDSATGRPVREPLTGHTGIVTALAFSPDGRLLASGSYDGSVRLWDPATGRPVRDPLTSDTDIVTALAFSPDGCLLATASGGKAVRLWTDAETQQEAAASVRVPQQSVSVQAFIALRDERDALAQRVAGLVDAAESVQARMEALVSALYEKLPPLGCLSSATPTASGRWRSHPTAASSLLPATT